MQNSVSHVYMIVLMQNDLKAGVEFYKRLGLTLGLYLENKWAEFECNGVKIGLCPGDVQPDRYTGLVFRTDDVQALYEELIDDGVEFVAQPVIATHGVMASLLDPSGNRLDLYQPTHEKVRQVLEKGGKVCGGENKRDKSGCCKKENGCKK